MSLFTDAFNNFQKEPQDDGSSLYSNSTDTQRLDPFGLNTAPLKKDTRAFGVEGEEFVKERWDITDLLSSLYAGSGETLRLLGRGSSIETVENFGQSIKESQFAKPDESTFRGEDTSLHKFGKDVVSGLPLSGALIGATALGGPVGLVGAGGVLTRGLYLDGIDRYWEKHPDDGNEDDARKYAAMHSAVEGITEVAGAGLAFAGSTFVGKISKPFLVNAIERGVLSTSDLLGEVAAKSGGKQFISRMLGGAVPEGGEEVVGSYVQDKIDTAYRMDAEKPDYWRTFLVGAASALPFTGIGAKITADKQNKIRNNIDKGLASDDLEQRQVMADQIFSTISKVNPEAAIEWKGYVDLNIEKGPLSIDDKNLIGSAWKANIAKQEDLGEINQITKNPSAILKDAGIPTGHAPSSNIYGGTNTPFVEPVEPTPLTAPLGVAPRDIPVAETPGIASYEKAQGPYAMAQAMGLVTPDTNQVAGEAVGPETLVQAKAKRDSILAKASESQASKGTTPGTATYLQPSGPYAMSQAMGEVIPDSNQVVQKTPTVPIVSKTQPAPITPQQTATISQEKPIESTKPEDNTDSIYTQEDLKGLKVELQGYNPKTKKVEMYKKDAYSAIKDVDEEIELYKDIMRCVKRS